LFLTKTNAFPKRNCKVFTGLEETSDEDTQAIFLGVAIKRSVCKKKTPVRKQTIARHLRNWGELQGTYAGNFFCQHHKTIFFLEKNTLKK